ncbi:class I SAM-dependent methyltransferase [Pseudomonas syringae]|uniref:class I SAM-dependent methyltransferase n=1 Tax=Pseudomonas syringae TaxID=317 RepID=UPI0018E5F986|nr:class I SAM-dependent methyltransferase [Pseudomonas syringae]MBI6818436.1 class I SAM-dependent methyltransferase [Pseudomonas syringae]MBI6824149.1 class I SAM-dependent methyltransferase [Pseudomonas syringae]
MSAKKNSGADHGTIEFYNKNSERYDQSTFNLKLETPWLEFTSRLRPNARILDVGCGSGRDMRHFIDLGYYVEGLEPSREMAKLARSRTGAIIHEISAEQIDFNNQFDGVWACASLLHIDRSSMEHTFNSIMETLKQSGVFYFSLKPGGGTIRKEDGRLFANYTKSEIEELVSARPDINSFVSWESLDALHSRNTTWLNFIVTKK